MPRPRKRHLTPVGWWLAAAVLGSVAYFLTPVTGAHGLIGAGFYCAVNAGSAAMIVVGVRRHRPRARAAWWAIAVGQLFFTGGDVAYYVANALAEDVTYPFLANLCYLAQYPCVAVGLLLLGRSRRSPGGGLAALIDTAITATGAAVLYWTFLIEPIVMADGLSTADRFAAAAYPVADLTVLAAALRLALTAGGRPLSYYLLLAYLGLTLVADTGYGLQSLLGSYAIGGWLDGGWLAAYAVLGVAALHPSMRRVEEAAPATAVGMSRARLVLLTGAVLIAPAVLTVQCLRGDDTNLLLIAGASSALFLLVLCRMAGLVAAQRQLAITDPLTGLHTRRFFEERLAAEAARYGRHNTAFGYLILDIDHFKSINDDYGHPAGDRVLVEVARRLRATCRASDVVARVGGEEFAVLIPDAGCADAESLAQRLRAAVAGEAVHLDERTSLPVTLSIGAAVLPLHATTARDLVEAADNALYTAKRTGRNRVAVAAPAGSGEPCGEQPGEMSATVLASWADAVLRILPTDPPAAPGAVTAVGAAWSFLRTEQPGRAALTSTAAAAELRRAGGVLFPVNIVEAFLRLALEGELTEGPTPYGRLVPDHRAEAVHV